MEVSEATARVIRLESLREVSGECGVEGGQVQFWGFPANKRRRCLARRLTWSPDWMPIMISVPARNVASQLA